VICSVIASKLLQLRNDLDRARTLLDMVRRREKQKKQLHALQFTIFEVTKEEVIRRERLKIERKRAKASARAAAEAAEAEKERGELLGCFNTDEPELCVGLIFACFCGFF